MNGIILINKEKGCTSHDVVYKVKKLTNSKVGHTGTLDPNATGVLPLLIGEATKISKYLSSSKAIILGPSSASMPKINNIYQVQIILKYKNTKDILENLKFIVDKYKSNKNVNIDVDINCLKI